MKRSFGLCEAIGRKPLAKRLTVSAFAFQILVSSAFPSHAHTQVSPAVSSLQAELDSIRAQRGTIKSRLDRMILDGPPVSADQQRLAQLRGAWPNRRDQLLEGVERDLAAEQARIAANRQRVLQQSSTRRATLQQDWNATQQRRNQYLANPPSTAGLERQISEQNAELQRVRLERTQVIQDLQTGMFCSECGRSRYELEHDGDTESFEQHLRRVNGRPIMKPEAIQAKQAEYAQRIAAISGRIGALQQRLITARADVQRRATEHETARATFNSEIARLDRENQEAETRYRAEMANLPNKRAELEQRVEEAERNQRTQEATIQRDIESKIDEHTDRMNDLLNREGQLNDYEGLLVTQLSFSQMPATSHDAHTTSVLQRLDRVLDGQLDAESIVDADLVKERALMHQLDMIEQALTIDPLSLDDNAQARATAAITQWVLEELGLDSGAALKAEIDAAYRRRQIRQQRIIMGLEPSPRACATAPRTCLNDTP